MFTKDLSCAVLDERSAGQDPSKGGVMISRCKQPYTIVVFCHVYLFPCAIVLSHFIGLWLPISDVQLLVEILKLDAEPKPEAKSLVDPEVCLFQTGLSLCMTMGVESTALSVSI
ncbi:hypothetical protein H671_1g0278 [Cricetulus griseus]|nr:hypothetical protein H671_1g0278 [Cricetulus griseus]